MLRLAVLSLLRRVSLRYVLGSRLRSALVVAGIALGVALHVATEVAGRSMMAAFGELVARVSGRSDLTIGGAGENVPGELAADVAETPGVAHAAASLEVTAQAVDLGESLLVLGVDLLGDLHFLPFQPEAGASSVVDDPLVFVNEPTALLLSERFAQRHGLEKDDSIRLLTVHGPKEFHVRGLVEDSGAAASFGGQVAVMFLDAAQIAFARGTMVDRIDIAVAEGADVDEVQARLAQVVGSGLRVERPERIGARLRLLGEPLEALLRTSSLLALIAAAFLVYNAVGVAVAQRRREVGLLRVLGVTRRNVLLMFCGEAFFLALPGVLLGLVLGYFLSQYTTAHALSTIDKLYVSVTQVDPQFGAALALRAALAGLGMAVAAALLPARRAAAVEPAPALRASAADRSRLRIVPLLAASAAFALLAFAAAAYGTWYGGALAGVFAIFCAAFAAPAVIVGLRALLARPLAMAFGLPARLGLDYVTRTLGRSSVNVLALMIAVATGVSSGGWLFALERSIERWAGQVGVADLTVTQGSPVADRRHVPMPAEAAERVASVDGVQRVQRYRMIDRQVKGAPLRLVATDIDVFLEEAARRGKGWQVLEGELPEPGELSTRPLLMVSDNAARRLNLHPGDSLALPTREGEVEFGVRTVVVDYTAPTGAAFLDRAQFLRYFGDEYLDGVFVYLAPGATPSSVASQIRSALGAGAESSAVFVTEMRAVEQHLVDSLRQTFSYSRSVELMMLLIALMGVIGTMTAAVIDRRREISTLRAIGGTSLQVAGTIVLESAFLGTCAAVAGAAVGVVESKIMVEMLLAMETGWHIEFVVPWGALARTMGWVIATSAIAGAVPAWRAARGTAVLQTPG